VLQTAQALPRAQVLGWTIHHRDSGLNILSDHILEAVKLFMPCKNLLPTNHENAKVRKREKEIENVSSFHARAFECH
jgi:hypothetical protein